MSAGSEKVKRWRRRFRARVVQALGGKCVECGYKKCPNAFETHHIDPDGKDFTFGSIRGWPRAAASLIAELHKVALVCKNCHTEIHSGLRTGPAESSFNEALYRELISARGD